MNAPRLARPVVTIPARSQPTKPDHTKVFLEPDYADGRAYSEDDGDDDTEDHHDGAA